MNCYQCQNKITVERAIGRQETCPYCYSYLHCCRNCEFYDLRAFHECREPEAEWVKEKDGGNFCVYFTPRTSHASEEGTDKRGEAKRKLDALFGKTEGGPQ